MTRTQATYITIAILGRCPRAATTALVLAIVLVASAVAIPPAEAQTYKVLHTFTARTDGASPYAGLLRDGAGNLYGTTYRGGASDIGTVYKIDKTGTESALYSFSGCCDVYKNGATPDGGLVRDAAGNLYGTTLEGGAAKSGTVFKLDTAGTETVIHSFTGTGGDGAEPYAGLIRDAAGNLYGTTIYAGDLACHPPYGCGTVFKLDAAGAETVLYSFTGIGGDGALAYGGLVLDAAGNLYGTTAGGGDLFCGAGNGCGIVFKLDTTGKETVLHIFTGTGGDGSNPFDALILDAAGNLYGTTSSGGDESSCIYGGGGCGTVFKLDTTGKETVLHSFTGSDGANPVAGLIRDAAGNLYGTTQDGGDLPTCDSEPGCGVVFKLRP